MARTASTTRRKPATRKTRSDGERSRSAILNQAARLATVEGIGGLSLSRLADEVGMSKSGLFAHFGSKEELQLAAIETADGIFAEHVLKPAEEAPAGIERLRALVNGYLDYVEARTFPGGCFFATVMVEVSMQPGAVRDRLVDFMRDWIGRLEKAIREAQKQSALDKRESPAELAFELESFLFLANTQFAVFQTVDPIKAGRRAIERRLKEAAA